MAWRLVKHRNNFTSPARFECWTYWCTIPIQFSMAELGWSPQGSVGLTRRHTNVHGYER
jgi:hypothetical protein